MSLPYPNAVDVKVFANEYINGNTINRALLRLFYNDNYLDGLSSLSPVAAPTVSNSLLVSDSPTTYTWKTDTEVKTLLGISDTVFGLSDVDASEVSITDTQALVWNSATSSFVSKDFVNALSELTDVSLSSLQNLHSLVYSAEIGAWTNAFPDDFTVGYVQHVLVEEDGKVLLPEVVNVGLQVQVVKYGTTTDCYIVPNAANKINGQSSKSMLSNNSDETTATIFLRSVLKGDATLEWITVGGDGTFDLVDTSSVPGSGLEIREITSDDLMLAPYEVTITNVPDASEVTKGIIRIATYAEGIAGVATDVCVNPVQLKYFIDNYAVPFATDVEAAAGVLEDVCINPLQLQTEITSKFIAVRADDTGTIVSSQGVASVSKEGTGHYRITFDESGTYVITGTADNTASYAANTAGAPRIVHIDTLTTTYVDIKIRTDNSFSQYGTQDIDNGFNVIGIKVA